MSSVFDEKFCVCLRTSFAIIARVALCSRLLSWLMPCRDCGREFAYARSEYCIGCAGVRTLGTEISQEWPSDQLRRVAADLIVSCARSVRALRLHRCPQNSQRPAEQQAGQVGGRSPLRRARGWRSSPKQV